jgi:hypothetical protein
MLGIDPSNVTRARPKGDPRATQPRPKGDPNLTQTPLYLHIGSTVPDFTQSFFHKNLMAFFLRFSRPGGRSNPATFRIPQVATRPADAVNLNSKNASVRGAPEVQKVQLFGSGLNTDNHSLHKSSYFISLPHSLLSPSPFSPLIPL